MLIQNPVYECFFSFIHIHSKVGTTQISFNCLFRISHDTSSFPCVSTGKESACSAGDLGSIPGLGRPWRRERLLTPVFWPGELHGLYSPWGGKELDTTECLSLSLSLYNHIMEYYTALERIELVILSMHGLL